MDNPVTPPAPHRHEAAIPLHFLPMLLVGAGWPQLGEGRVARRIAVMARLEEAPEILKAIERNLANGEALALRFTCGDVSVTFDINEDCDLVMPNLDFGGDDNGEE